jgi:hypothetical protein
MIDAVDHPKWPDINKLVVNIRSPDKSAKAMISIVKLKKNSRYLLNTFLFSIFLLTMKLALFLKNYVCSFL